MRISDWSSDVCSSDVINVLSWATESLIADGRGMGDTKQGVTLEIFGEGWSMGPLNDAMKADALKQQGDIRYPIEWTTLGEYLEFLAARGDRKSTRLNYSPSCATRMTSSPCNK